MKHLAIFAILAVAACSADPISYSAPVGINLKVRSSDVSAAAITEDKSITTETSNPYGAFVNAATAKLGRAPGRIEVDQLMLVLSAQSTNVTQLEAVFTGAVDVAFVMNDSNDTYDVGSVSNPTGAGPVTLTVSLDGAAIAPQDFTRYLGGSFKVVAAGTAAAGFTSKNAEADLQLTFTFAAFE